MTRHSPHSPDLDVICLGRVAVDLYAEQIGARLEDATSFKKYLGGSSGNMAYGTARLGLNSSMLGRVGNEQMGEFLREELASVGCDVSHLKRDPERLTGLVLLGIKDKDIQTTGINLSAQYDYDQSTSRQVFRGYQASNRVNVTLREVPRAGEVLDALVAAGATDINGPNFSLDDDTGARAQARKAAFEKARAQAEEYARWSGFSGVRLLEINESVAAGPPMPYAQSAERKMMDVSAAPTPVEPGLVGTMVSLTVKFEMTR